MVKKKLSTYIEVDDNTPMFKLGVKDQLRVIFNMLSKDDARELENEDSFAIDETRRRANLEDFFHKATQPIREGRATSVTMSISSEFETVLDEVLNSRALTFYTAQVHRPAITYNVSYNILVRLEVKH